MNRRKGPSRDATAEGATRTATTASVGVTGGAMDYRLPMAASVERGSIASPLGYSYRDNVLAPINLDRIQAFCLLTQINLDGGVKFNAGDWLTGEWLDYVDDTFWPRSFPKLVNLCEARDGYKPTTDALTNVDAIKDRMVLIAVLKSQIRVLWTLFHCMHYNQATYAMNGLRTVRSRMQRILELSDTIRYPAEFEPWIQHLSRVFTPYPGGPVCFKIIYPESSCLLGAGAFQDWSALGMIDLTSATEIEYLLKDLELIISELTGGCGDANRKADYRLIESIFSMLQVPVPKTPVSPLTVDAMAFDDLFRNAFIAKDNKGGGDDVYVVYPDIQGSMDTLIPIQFNHPPDDLDWAGMKWAYAAEHPTQATGDPWSKTTENMVVRGCVLPTYYDATLAAPLLLPTYMVYTIEDGWVTITDDIDETAVAGPQLWQWKNILGAHHQYAWAMAASEEVEETYNTEWARPASVRFQMPVNHIGEQFAKFLHAALRVPIV